MPNYDLYQEVNNLIILLRRDKLIDYADKLQLSMEGTTGTEIVMALKWYLERLVKDKQCNSEGKIKANKIIEELNKF